MTVVKSLSLLFLEQIFPSKVSLDGRTFLWMYLYVVSKQNETDATNAKILPIGNIFCRTNNRLNLSLLKLICFSFDSISATIFEGPANTLHNFLCSDEKKDKRY